MSQQLFRKESLDRISSPEELHDYMRVTSPKLWMLLSAIIALLVGFIVYASTATLESTIPIKVSVDYGIPTADLSIAQLDVVKIHMPVRIAGETAEITDISQNSRLALKVRFDDRSMLEDGVYEMEFDNKEGLSEEVASQMNILVVDNGNITTYDYRGQLEQAFQEDRRIRVEGKLGTVTDASVYDYATIMIALDDVDKTLADGKYDAQIVTESTTPINFLLN